MHTQSDLSFVSIIDYIHKHIFNNLATFSPTISLTNCLVIFQIQYIQKNFLIKNKLRHLLILAVSSPEADFLDEIQTKVLRVCLLAMYSHLL